MNHVMKKIVFIIMTVLVLISCDNNHETQLSDNPSVDTVSMDSTGFTVALSYDSMYNTITAVPSDSTIEYVFTVWMVQDFILDYGNDFSDAHIKSSFQDYLDMCIVWSMAFPTFVGSETMDVYEFFDQPYPGEEFIAMAAKFNMKTKKIEGDVFHINFTTSN